MCLYSHTFQLRKRQSQILKHTISFWRFHLAVPWKKGWQNSPATLLVFRSRQTEENVNLDLFFPLQLEKGIQMVSESRSVIITRKEKTWKEI